MKRVLQLFAILLVAGGIWMIATAFITPPPAAGTPIASTTISRPPETQASRIGLGVAMMVGGVLAGVIFFRR